MTFFVDNIYLVPIFSFVAFLIISTGNSFGLYRDKKISMYLTVFSTGLGLLFSVFALLHCYFSDGFSLEKTFDWIVVDNLQITVGWFLDNLAAAMLVMIGVVSLLVQIYSGAYMDKDVGYSRFFAYLALFNFSMTGLVLCPNLFQTYIFWELVGMCSYFLIGFWYAKKTASNAAFKAFIVNRIGDLGLLLGLIAFGYFSLNYWISSGVPFLAFSDLNMATFYMENIYGAASVNIIGCLLLAGAVAKSAQFPLHVWLPDAMEAPTPVSALIHAATMVAAGVFLVARLYPIFSDSLFLMQLIAVIGAITALLCAFFALVEVDIKRVLAYSTCSQLGFMFMAMGSGAYSAGLFHLINHAFFKALLFLCAGAVIFSLHHEQDIRYMGGLRKRIPVVACTFLIGTLAISGLFLSGFFSKEAIFEVMLANQDKFMILVFSCVSVMTALYMFRLYFMVFEGEYRGTSNIVEIPKVMSVPLILLAVPSAILGALLSGAFDFAGIKPFEDFVYYSSATETLHSGYLVVLKSLLKPLIGLGVAFLFYFYSKNIFSPSFWVPKISLVHKAFVHHLYIDVFYEKVLSKGFYLLSSFLDFFDNKFIDGLVNLSEKCLKLLSYLFGFSQKTNIGAYIVLSVCWLVFACLLLAGFKYFFV